MPGNLTHNELFKMTIDMVSSYMSNNAVSLDDVSSIISKIYQTLSAVNETPNSFRGRPVHQPAVPISESVTDEYIVCLEDGKKLQMLKRHLNTVYKMSLEQYKERWNLPMDYPVVSPNYAKRRSQIAKNTGLGLTGRRRRQVA